MLNHSDGDHAATNPRLSADLAGNSGGPASFPGDPYAVTAPPGNGHPLAGYRDPGYADDGWGDPATPPAGELPRGRHSGAAVPPGEAG